ncbi:SPOR domain-containing protein [Fodinibius halophilus]|uniref:SPOR domain-containing protein n=1 Tax=Fodinibius halophilus TaxID=1736908 RepID=A0A6M1T4R5_9BACT|nr:SPOR domain-containing protein [Fodinibius halophilus]NGP89037.1 SPOR domain-containing protein [Fodinibius halophilus]
MTQYLRNTVFFLLILSLMVIGGCSTTQKATDDRKATAADSTALSAATDLQKLLNENRSKLSDLYVSQQQDMPQGFLKKDSSNTSFNRNPFDGYRVQILSTRDITLADSVTTSFRMWADTTIAGYDANAYQSFRSPYYKVHIGDFQDRSKANSFSQLIKDRYPSAWVVHDRINPSKVPADTASFSFKENEEDSLSIRN